MHANSLLSCLIAQLDLGSTKLRRVLWIVLAYLLAIGVVYMYALLNSDGDEDDVQSGYWVPICLSVHNLLPHVSATSATGAVYMLLLFDSFTTINDIGVHGSSRSCFVCASYLRVCSFLLL